jgi:ribosome maturation factor RimP
MKTLHRITLSLLLASGLGASSLSALAQTSGKAVNFDGNVSSYDQSTRTLKVGGNSYQILPTSRITKSDQTSSADALSSGQHVAGTYKESAEGKREVIALDVTQNAGGSQQAQNFQGKVSSYDQASRTIKVDGETYQLLPTSRIMKSDARSSADALAAGQKVEVRYKESAEGKREIITLDIAGDIASATGAAQDVSSTTSGSSFEGKVDKVNRNAKTFTINGQTYQILPTTRMAGRRGGTIDMGDLKADQRVEGTYKDSAEGKREVLTLDIPRRGNSSASNARDNASNTSGATFQGKVDRVNQDSSTFVINGQTYQVLPTTRITDRSGNAAQKSSLQRDQRVQGTYHESDTGRREVVTMEITR